MAKVDALVTRAAARDYLDVDLARLIADNGADGSGSAIKEIFDEAEQRVEATGREAVMFMDEFHQLVMLSAAAVEAIKPVLAMSGARGLRIVAATTEEEFLQYISPNLPLVERLQRINLSPPSNAAVTEILRGMAERYGARVEDSVLDSIVEFTNRYQPASVQPRKAILVLDGMIGWHRSTGRAMDQRLLAEVLETSTGVKVAIGVDAAGIKAALDQRVLSQRFATTVVADRLQLCVADLNDPKRPLSSFLFVGPTGVGKRIADYELVPVLGDDGVCWKRHGDLVVDDVVFGRRGQPERVIAVFPMTTARPMYRVTLTDGRTLDVGDEHLFAVHTAKTRDQVNKGLRGFTDWLVMSTQELFDAGVVRHYPPRSDNARGRHLKYFVPMNGAVEWPARRFVVDPYVVGAMIGNGCMTMGVMTFSSNDEETVAKIAASIGSPRYARSGCNYSWTFDLPESRSGKNGYSRVTKFQTADLFGEMPELFDRKSQQKRIPGRYMSGSVEQRWELVRGLLDTDGHIEASDELRYGVSYSTFSEGLANDLRELLFSLGVASTIVRSERTRLGEHGEERRMVEFCVHVKSANDDKERFFHLERKREAARRAAEVVKTRAKKFDMVGITNIEPIGEQTCQCIYVDDDEHLYQAGDFVVTHNTELSKALAELLFGDDQRHLIRFDMTEFSQAKSMDLFRTQLTSRVWTMGNGVVLLDEIEKADGAVIRLLLQVLDDGRLTDANGRQVSFLNCYFVLTSNAGSEIFRTIGAYDADDTGSGAPMRERMKEIRRSLVTTQSENRFPPELLGRIDAIVPFQPLSLETLRGIVQVKMANLRDDVARKHGIRVTFDKRVLAYLVDDRSDADTNAGGARAAVGLLESDVATPVAAFVNANPRARALQVYVDGVLRTEDKQLRSSTARIRIAQPRQEWRG